MKTGEDRWGQPAFFQVVGGPFGPQIGVAVSKALLVVNTGEAMDALLDGGVELGTSLSVAVGPDAIDASTDKDVAILTFTLWENRYAGISLEGSMIVTDEEGNHAYYGGPVNAHDIVRRGKLSNDHADGFREALARLASDI